MNDTDLRSELLHRVEYDAKEGTLRRKAGFTGVKAGALLGSLTSDGRLQATFLGKRRQVSHLIWLAETGSLPSGVVVYVDGDKANNRFSNLLDRSLSELAHDSPQAVAARTRKAILAQARSSVKYWRPSTAMTKEERLRRERERRAAQGDKRRAIVRKSCKKHHAANKDDPHYRAGKAARQIINRTVRAIAKDKIKSTEALLGYTIDQFRHHIESQFESWMNWGNHGEWHIDHIKPVAAFLSEGETALHVINALDNLRPLLASDNLEKGSSYA